LKDSTITRLRVEARFLRPDVAIVRWTWKIAGDKNPDGSSRNPRYGLMTMIAEKRNGKWRAAASQNDNSARRGARIQWLGIANADPRSSWSSAVESEIVWR
jgi:hypothetical protein